MFLGHLEAVSSLRLAVHLSGFSPAHKQGMASRFPCSATFPFEDFKILGFKMSCFSDSESVKTPCFLGRLEKEEGTDPPLHCGCTGFL